MSRDRYTEVRYNSWFSRMGNSIKGVLFGAIMLIVAFPLLFWNEGQLFKQHGVIKEAMKIVVPVESGRVDLGNEGNLVHLTGQADTNKRVHDTELNISTPTEAIKLKRNVWMYQWEETVETREEKTIGGGSKTVTTYHYNKVWSKTMIDSSHFSKPSGHQNPNTMPYKTQWFFKENTRLGDFTLTKSLIKQIDNYDPMPLPSNTSIPDPFKGNGIIHNGELYVGRTPQSPQVGDLRIVYANVVEPTTVSVVAQQSGNSFQAHQLEDGSVELLQVGEHSAKDMLNKLKAEQSRNAWGLRLLGFSLMWIALAMMLKPLSVMFDILPILGNFVEYGANKIAFVVAFALSTTTISIAWLSYRPVMAIGLIAVVGGTVYVLKNRFGGRTFGRIIQE